MIFETTSALMADVCPSDHLISGYAVCLVSGKAVNVYPVCSASARQRPCGFYVMS